MSFLLENLAQLVLTNYLLLIVLRNYNPVPQRQQLLQNFNDEITQSDSGFRLTDTWNCHTGDFLLLKSWHLGNQQKLLSLTIAHGRCISE